MNYYKVEAKCGHVGRNKYVVKCFPVCADSGKEAAKQVRDFPRVKHHHKDAILSTSKISEEEFYELHKNNDNDPYFKCTCVQDQRRYEETEIFEDENFLYKIRSKKIEIDNKPIFVGKTKIRNPKRYYNELKIKRMRYIYE